MSTKFYNGFKEISESIGITGEAVIKFFKIFRKEKSKLRFKKRKGRKDKKRREKTREGKRERKQEK